MHACSTETLPTVIPGKSCVTLGGRTGVQMVKLVWRGKPGTLTIYSLILYPSKLKSD